MYVYCFSSRHLFQNDIGAVHPIFATTAPRDIVRRGKIT